MYCARAVCGWVDYWVLCALIKISTAPGQLGKPLEPQPGRSLCGCRSAYVDRKAIRIT